MILRYLLSGLLGIWMLGTTAVFGFYSPQHVMVDVTNDFGICVLQLISSKKENIAFSPYGLVSVALVLYEGSTGPSAAEIHNSLRLPWDREVTRVGFRDMHRYLKSYFSNDGFLRGLVLSKPNIGLRKNYTDLLQFYGFDVRTSQPHIPQTPGPPVLTTMKPIATQPIPTTTKRPQTTIVPEKTTTTPAPDTTLFTFSSKFGSTTTENPKQQTTLFTTLKEKQETTLQPQTNLPSSRTTLERATETTTAPPTTASRLPTTGKPQTTTTVAPPTSTTMKPTVTTTPTTTTQATTTTKPPTTTSPTTTPKPPETTSTSPKPITDAPTPTTTPPTLVTAKAVDSTQSGTTLDVVTMTDKKPDAPEIMSQINSSAITTVEATSTTQNPIIPVSTPITTPVASVTEKAVDITQAGTTLDVVTMTNKKPNTPEIMSQINPSAITTTVEPSPDMQERGGDSDMEIGMMPGESTTGESTLLVDTTTKPLETTTEAYMAATQTTEMMEPKETTVIVTNKPTSTTSSPQEITTLKAETVEVSVAETTIVKSVNTLNPNTTPTPDPGNEKTIAESESSTIPIQPGGLTLVIETTTAPPSTSVSEDNTAMASESMIDQATEEPEATIVPSNDDISSASPVENITMLTEVTTNPSSTVQVVQLTEGVFIQVPTTPQTTTTDAVPPTTLVPETTSPQTTTPAPNNLEMIDSAASENRLVAALNRQQRSLYSTHKTPERHQSGSNWVPRYYDQRWGQSPSNEFWFFTYTGGENVPAHTYTAYLPFAFVPELSSLALQLPLDDPRYSILILLPEERLGLSQLLYSLQWCPVRAIITHLKMTAVYAVVPAFTIVKHINLVPALAKLGIHSVFDPFRADLSPMTSEPHLFVRTIEQVVTVSLRKYYASNRWFEAAPNEIQQHFVANHPFVYFVLDKETDVTLMAGTIVNPVAHNQ